MKILGFNISRETRDANPEDPRMPISAEGFLKFMGIESGNLTTVTAEKALQVPAWNGGVTFLSRTLASLPLHAYKRKGKETTRDEGDLEAMVHENPNPYMDTFKFRQYFWSQVFTEGRGLAYIERKGGVAESLWPINPIECRVARKGFKVTYTVGKNVYKAEDVIDIPYLLRPDQTRHYRPLTLANKALQLSLAMNDYASGFFAGGGVPPLALFGPLPAGADAQKRQLEDVMRAVKNAKDRNQPILGMPPGHELKPIGFDPEKGQMTDARRFQIEEIARVLQLPPIFLQDLTHASYTNAEQQDLHLVKHVIGQWSEAFEGEMNLKLFGRTYGKQYVEHNLDGLLRGDFASRMDGHSKAIQVGLETPNEGRALENKPPLPGGEKLYMQGAMLPIDKIGNQPAATPPAAPPADPPKPAPKRKPKP